MLVYDSNLQNQIHQKLVIREIYYDLRILYNYIGKSK